MGRPGPASGGSTLARRADAGVVRLGGRDVAGLVLCADMYGAPYDLLAAYLRVREFFPRAELCGLLRERLRVVARARPGQCRDSNTCPCIWRVIPPPAQRSSR